MTDAWSHTQHIHHSKPVCDAAFRSNRGTRSAGGLQWWTMPADNKNAKSLAAGADRFDTTHWSLVLAAGQRGTGESAAALERLCQSYWLPLYAYVRRRVSDVHDAQDLTQAFFERLLEKNYLADADPQRGRFRVFY